MRNSWKTNDCPELKASYDIYTIPRAAALWCGVPEHKVEEIIQESKLFSTQGKANCIWVHPKFECLGIRSRAISVAVGTYLLRCVNPDGSGVDRCAELHPEDRYILGRDLKNWMESTFPNDKPAFLFTDSELNSYAIKTNVYQKLKKERDNLEKQLEEASEVVNVLKKENESIKAERDSLQVELTKMDLNPRSKMTYLRTIAALLECILGKAPGIEKHPSFANQSKLIDLIDSRYSEYGGISKSTLSHMFPEAKRSL